MSRAARCRTCGCTDARACATISGGCHWVEPDLCSACADLSPGHVVELYLDHPKLGSGYRRLLVIEAKRQSVDVFEWSTLTRVRLARQDAVLALTRLISPAPGRGFHQRLKQRRALWRNLGLNVNAAAVRKALAAIREAQHMARP